MVSTRIGLAVVGASCLVAAGTGGYFATRYSTGATAPAATSATADRGAEQVQGRPVDETEAVMDDHGPASATAATDPATRAPSPPQATPQPRNKIAANPPSTPAPAGAAGRERAGRPASQRPATGHSSVPAASPHPSPSPAPAATEASRSAETPVGTDARAEGGGRPLPAEAAPEAPRRIDPVEQPKWQEKQIDELVVSADSVIGLQLKNTVSSELSHVEDRVEAQVARDVPVNGRVAIPAGSRVLGTVTVVERGGKMRDRARLGVRFHTLVLADGATLPLQTDTVYREGDSPASASAAKMGGAAIGGAIVGAILGGGKGAVIGGATGAAGGTAAVMAGSRKPATFNAGSTVTVRVLSPVTVTVDR